MKKITSLLILLILHSTFLILHSFGQGVPQAMTYQAVARDTNGNLKANAAISVRFSILDGSATGSVVYEETQSVTTNKYGLFTVNIGQGVQVGSQTFSSINWGGNSKWVMIEADLLGGTNYMQIGTPSQLLSVPYALYAGNAAGSTGLNTAYGDSSLYSETIANDLNTAYGYNALNHNNGGSYNTAIGANALYYNNGSWNVANGYEALIRNTSGSNNTANGAGALYYNTTGGTNTANGESALSSNTTGNNNTANGAGALAFNRTGNNNTADGYFSLYNSTGIDNTSIGDSALYSNITGSYNTALGANANVGSGNLTNATAIGANAVVSASNALVLGNNANVGIGTSNPGSSLQINARSEGDGLELIGSTSGPKDIGVKFNDNTSNAAFIGFASAANAWMTGVSPGDLVVGDRSGKVWIGSGNSSATPVMMVSGSNVTVNGNVALSGPSPASTTGFANTLTPKNLVKAWGVVEYTPFIIDEGGPFFTVIDGFNLSSFGNNAQNTGMQINFATALGSSTYAVIVQDAYPGSVQTPITYQTYNLSSDSFSMGYPSRTAIFSFIVVGY